jgi:hypothetical protein
MKREKAASVLTASALLLTLGLVLVKNQGWTLASASPSAIARLLLPRTIAPEDAIYAMLDAAKAGDVNAYLASYSGQMNNFLKHSAEESGPGAFEKYLRSSNAAIQGIALSPPQSVSDSQVKVRVEYVYRDRNEVQFIYLRKESSRWKIYQVDGAEPVKTLVPYGSVVTD